MQIIIQRVRKLNGKEKMINVKSRPDGTNLQNTNRKMEMGIPGYEDGCNNIKMAALKT